ncbi:MAG: hypothetical protein NTU45_12075 [Planctomycetota bacterium]|jgi:hypothetical protein|nr:hypothetical protein [Planctomycetota bacterium]
MQSEATATTEQLDDPEMGSTWFYSIVGIIIFVVFCLAVSVLFFGVEDGFVEDQVIDKAPALSTTLRSEQQGLLGQYGTYAEEVDDKKVERVRIPIDRAIELMSSQTK